MTLWSRIIEWRSASPIDLEIYGCPPELDRSHSCPEPEDEQLALPSTIPSDPRFAHLRSIELRLREGQANDALKDIRACISQKLVLLRDKKANARGQFANAAANTVIARFDGQLSQAAALYRHNYRSMLSLGMSDSHSLYRKLDDDDLKASNVFNSKRTLGRGTAIPVSWVWHNSTTNHSLDGKWLQEGQSLML